MVTYQRGSDKEDDAPEEKELSEINQNGGVAGKSAFELILVISGKD